MTGELNQMVQYQLPLHRALAKPKPSLCRIPHALQSVTVRWRRQRPLQPRHPDIAPLPSLGTQSIYAALPARTLHRTAIPTATANLPLPSDSQPGVLLSNHRCRWQSILFSWKNPSLTIRVLPHLRLLLYQTLVIVERH